MRLHATVTVLAKDIASWNKPRRTLRVSTSGYYRHLHARSVSKRSSRVQRRRDLEVKILAYHGASRRTYRSPRFTADLAPRLRSWQTRSPRSWPSWNPRMFKARQWSIRPRRSRRPWPAGAR